MYACPVEGFYSKYYMQNSNCFENSYRDDAWLDFTKR